MMIWKKGDLKDKDRKDKGLKDEYPKDKNIDLTDRDMKGDDPEDDLKDKYPKTRIQKIQNTPTRI